MSNITISFAVTVCNEHEEVRRLIDQLLTIIEPDDELVIQGDQGKVTDAVVSVIHKHLKNPQIKYIEYPLKKNFAAYKNNLFKECTKQYIVNIDADELLSDNLADMIRTVIAMNPNVDLFRLPRVNIVDGITHDIMNAWGWRSNSSNWVNFPDYQARIVRNGQGIKWVNPVHETLTGFKTVVDFPESGEWSLLHIKTIDRQIKQNEFYSTFNF